MKLSKYAPPREIETRRFATDDMVEYVSLDPSAGGTYANKPIWTVDQISDNLNRTGWDWYTNQEGQIDDGVLNFAFFNTQEDFFGTGYIDDNFTTAFSEFFDFQAFTPEQREAARGALAMWDDLVNIRFQEVDSVLDADIRFGNTDTGGAQAYAYLPFGTIFNDPAGSGGFTNLDDLGGDVWVDKNVASNFFPLSDSYYSITTLIHETGHALGLSHPGDYDALDDNDGDGVPDPITYANDAFFAQDSLQYSIMSYFDGYETGAQYIDWSLLNFAYPATPMVHDIAAIQAIYGADPNTRTGDTVYGFNSTADRSAFDFTVNTRPVITVYDAGGNDTLDFSGWDTPSVIDLNDGAYSSGGGIEQFLTLDEINANRAALGFAPRTQAQFDLYETLFKQGLGLTNGFFRDNVAIAYGTIIENAVGGGGNDLIIANEAANRLDGGGGNDTVSYASADSGVVASLLLNRGFTGAAAGDRYTSIENLTGTAYNDVLTGDFHANVINGGAGGRDTLIGGFGGDTVSYADSTVGVGLDLGENRTSLGARDDVVIGFDNAIGSEFSDRLVGGSGRNTLDGRGGDDFLDGESGNDALLGGDGADTLNGGSGDDVLNGGAGADRLNGESGRDTYAFDVADGANDTIVRFERGRDKIDLSDLDAVAGNSGHDAFSWIGSNAFSGHAGELRVFRDGQSMVVQGDVNGDGVADLLITVQNTTALNQADFVIG